MLRPWLQRLLFIVIGSAASRQTHDFQRAKVWNEIPYHGRKLCPIQSRPNWFQQKLQPEVARMPVRVACYAYVNPWWWVHLHPDLLYFRNFSSTCWSPWLVWISKLLNGCLQVFSILFYIQLHLPFVDPYGKLWLFPPTEQKVGGDQA
jgi:hypothetical protein